MVSFWKVYFALLLLLLLRRISAFETEEEEDSQCACRFQADDPSNCRVYGQLGDGVLIPWHRASQGCLDTFGIKDEAVDPFTLKRMFPQTGSGTANIAALVSYLRFNDDTVATGIKKSLVDFFEEDPATQKAVFQPEIVVHGKKTIISCEESTRKCWTALQKYLKSPENQNLVEEIGKTLYNLQALSLEKEQSVVRIRLCREGFTLECASLSNQIQDYVHKLGDAKYCSAYGLGPKTDDLPYCTSGPQEESSSSYGVFSVAGYAINWNLLGGPYLVRTLRSLLGNMNLL